MESWVAFFFYYAPRVRVMNKRYKGKSDYDEVMLELRVLWCGYARVRLMNHLLTKDRIG